MVIHEQSKSAVVLKELANNNSLDAELNEKLKKEIDDLKAKNTKIMEAYWKVAADAVRLETEKLVASYMERTGGDRLDLEKSREKRLCYTSEFGPEFDRKDPLPKADIYFAWVMQNSKRQSEKTAKKKDKVKS